MIGGGSGVRVRSRGLRIVKIEERVSGRSIVDQSSLVLYVVDFEAVLDDLGSRASYCGSK